MIFKKGDVLTVEITLRQLEEIGIDEDEIIGAEVKCLYNYCTGYVQIEWDSPNYGLIKYDIPRWFLKK